MSRLGEETLIRLLADTDAIEFLARDGLDLQVVPTQALRPVVEWSLGHYRRTGKAPSVAVLKEHYGDLLSDHEVSLDEDVEETIEWALDDLKASYVRNEAGSFSRRLATSITEADPDDRLDVLGQFASELSALSMSLQPRTTQVDLRRSGGDILLDYDEAVATRGHVIGMALGLPQIDSYTRGIHEGELGVLAGGPKTGKSWFLNYASEKEWERERCTALFTLENSIKMARMRIACVAQNISITDMQAGNLSDDDYERLRWWVNDVLLASDVPFLVFNPTLVARTPQAIVQAARAHGVESLFIDQLTFMDVYEKQSRRDLEIRSILHDLKGLISTGRNPIPCLLAHQINREGVKAAEKTGRLSMYHMAEGSEVERTADWAFGLYASDDMRAVGEMLFQTLATRRGEANRDFDLMWQIDVGRVMVRNEVQIP